MKEALAGLLTLLLFPLALPLSAIIVALMLVVMILFSPILISGFTLLAAAKVSTLLTDWLFPYKDNDLDSGNKEWMVSVSITVILFPFLIVPVAVAAAVTAASISVLLIPCLAAYGPYCIIEQAINHLFDALHLNNEEEKEEPIKIKNCYSILPPKPGSERTSIDIPNFDNPFNSTSIPPEILSGECLKENFSLFDGCYSK